MAGRKAWIDSQEGRAFGRLTVICRGSNIGRHPQAIVQCSCGSHPKQVLVHHLKRGSIRSCGCLVDSAQILAEVTKRLGHEPAYARWLRKEGVTW